MARNSSAHKHRCGKCLRKYKCTHRMAEWVLDLCRKHKWGLCDRCYWRAVFPDGQPSIKLKTADELWEEIRVNPTSPDPS